MARNFLSSFSEGAGVTNVDMLLSIHADSIWNVHDTMTGHKVFHEKRGASPLGRLARIIFGECARGGGGGGGGGARGGGGAVWYLHLVKKKFFTMFCCSESTAVFSITRCSAGSRRGQAGRGIFAGVFFEKAPVTFPKFSMPNCNIL